MPCSELTHGRNVVGQRKNDTCRLDAVTANDDGSVVQRRIRKEDIDQQLTRQSRVKWHAFVCVVLQACFTLNNDERSESLSGKLSTGANDFVDHVLNIFFGSSRKRRAQPGTGMPELFKRAANFGLEDDRYRDHERRPRLGKKPIEGRQVERRCEK